MSTRGLLLLALTIAAIPVCFLRPFYGVLLWVVLAFLNPQSYIWSTDIFPVAQVTAIPTLLGVLAFSFQLRRFHSFKVLLIVLLWGWFTTTALISTNTSVFVHHAADTWERWQFVTKVLLMALLTVTVVDGFQRLRTFVLIVAGCFGAFVLKAAVFLIATKGQFRVWGPPNSMIADNNDFGLALNMTLPLFFYLSQSETNRWVKGTFACLAVLTIPAVFFTYSRGALVGLIGVMAWMLLRSRHRIMLLPVIAVALVIALVYAPDAWKTRMQLTSEEVVDGSAQARLNSWTFAWNLALDYPISGGGFATFTPELHAVYAPVARQGHAFGAHSVYFGVLAEHGFVGLILYLTLILSCFTGLYRLVRRARAYGDGLVVHYANMFEVSLIAFLLSGTFLGRAYFDYYFTIVVCIIILERVAKEEWAEWAFSEEDSSYIGEQLYLPEYVTDDGEPASVEEARKGRYEA